jgi:hypothetical protein
MRIEMKKEENITPAEHLKKLDLNQKELKQTEEVKNTNCFQRMALCTNLRAAILAVKIR